MPQFMRMTGRDDLKFSRKVNLVDALYDGKSVGYEVPVSDVYLCGPESLGVPSLCGLIQFAGDNAWCCSKIGRIYCFPIGSNVGCRKGFAFSSAIGFQEVIGC